MFRRSISGLECMTSASMSTVKGPSLFRLNSFFAGPESSDRCQSVILQSLVTHMIIRNSGTDNKESLAKKASACIRQHPYSHLTIMTPTTLLDYEKCPNVRRPISDKGYINPGHIHSGCTNDEGQTMDEGDASFSTTGKSLDQMLTPTYDSRLEGYRPREISLSERKFTSSIHEIRKWAAFAEKYKDYPLYILARSFNSEEERKKYLEVTAEIKRMYAEHHYVMMSYYKFGSDKIMPAKNCVSFNKELNEKYFKVQLNLGDNPTTQTTYIELMKTLYPMQKRFPRMVQAGDHLSEVHHEKEERENFSLVI